LRIAFEAARHFFQQKKKEGKKSKRVISTFEQFVQLNQELLIGPNDRILKLAQLLDVLGELNGKMIRAKQT